MNSIHSSYFVVKWLLISRFCNKRYVKAHENVKIIQKQMITVGET